MRILHVNGFSTQEKLSKLEDIKRNIRDAILVSIIAKKRAKYIGYTNSKTR